MLSEEVRGRQYNLGIIWFTLILVTIGVYNLYSATYGSAGEAQYWKIQIYRFIFGACVAGGIFFIHYRVLERFAYLAYGINVVLLVLVLAVGRQITGSQRWIELGPLTIQPSEFMKITIAWTLAKYFHDDKQRPSYGLKSLIFPCLLVVIPMLLIYSQPDLGTALIILATSACMFLFVKVNLPPVDSSSAIGNYFFANCLQIHAQAISAHENYFVY